LIKRVLSSISPALCNIIEAAGAFITFEKIKAPEKQNLIISFFFLVEYLPVMGIRFP
jgi:hypothetical protein